MTEITETKAVSLAGMKPLTVKEAERLDKLEKVISDNFKGFYAVGCALKEIRDSHLYREKKKTFEEYCKEVWETGRRTAYRYIDAVNAYENVSNWSQTENLPEPANEAQVRHLTRKELTPEDQIICWKTACAKAAEAKKDVNAYYVEQAVVEFLGGRAKRKLKDTVQKATRANFTIDFNKALAPVIRLIEQAIETNWKGFDRKKVIELIDNLRAIAAGKE